MYIVLIGGGVAAGHWLTGLVEVDLRPSSEPQIHSMVMFAMAVYVLAAALPFVPGAEIGAALMIVFGVRIVLLVYVAMVAALLLSFLVGRIVPVNTLAALFDFLGLRRAGLLVENMSALPFEERLAYLIRRAPTRIVPALLRHRYAALVLILNTPGNTLMGGGGGIALLAGISRLFTFTYFTVAVAVAVAPIPLLVILTGYQPFE
ncbi:MAG: hypothetical protein U5R46_00100 [Gammaproteobacteria bacterium]|nr:hypothetical protein [Gammaproteobacteria bacterium]